MTLTTMVFNDHKKDGLVTKAGRAFVKDGTRVLTRTVYRDAYDNTCYVIINGDAKVFHEYTHTFYNRYDDITMGGYI